MWALWWWKGNKTECFKLKRLDRAKFNARKVAEPHLASAWKLGYMANKMAVYAKKQLQ